LLRTRGNEDVLRTASDAEARHMPGDPVAERRIALADGVLQRLLGAPGILEDAAMRGGKRRGREKSGIGNAAGEGDDLGIVDELQELADLGGGHAARARGEMALPGDHNE